MKSEKTEKFYTEIFHDYQDFLFKKKQYARAVHVFHDQTGEYQDLIGNLSSKEIPAAQKEFLRHERDFHDVMDSFERSLALYNKAISRLGKIKSPITFSFRNKKYRMKIEKDELSVDEIRKTDALSKAGK